MLPAFNRYGDLREIPQADDHRARGSKHVWVDQAVADAASKKRPGNERIRVREGMPGVVFLLAWAFAARARKLTVESIELFGFWIELVRVSFDEFPNELGVHFNNGHVATVSQLV